MDVVGFSTKISNGRIDVPLQYQGEYDFVKVILIKEPPVDTIVQANAVRTAKGFGALAHRANPDLRELEENAWERAVVEKYADS